MGSTDPRSEVRLRLARYYVERVSLCDTRLGDVDGAHHALAQLEGDWPHVRILLDWAADLTKRSAASDPLWRRFAECEIVKHRADPLTQARWWQASLRVASRLGDVVLQIKARLALARVWAELPGQFERAAQLVEQAERLAERAGDPSLRARALIARAHVVLAKQLTWLRGDEASIEDWLLSTETEVDFDALEPRLQAELLLCRGMTATFLARLRGQARTDLARAKSMLSRCQDPLLEIGLLEAEYSLLTYADPIDSRERLARRVVDLSERFQSRGGLRFATTILASLYLERGKIELAHEWIDRRRPFEGGGGTVAGYWDALCEMNRGEFSRAETMFGKLANASAEGGFSSLRIMVVGAAQALTMAFLRGNAAGLVRLTGLALSGFPDDRRVAAAAAFAFAQAGRPQDALRHLERARPFALDESVLVAFGVLWHAAEAATEIGAEDIARELYEVFLPCSGRVISFGYVALTFGAVDRTLGRIASLLGRQDEAISRLDAALALDERIGAPTWAALTRLDRARALLARGQAGDVARACQDIDVAGEIATRLGMRLVTQRCDALDPRR